MADKVAVLVDGDNISADHAACIALIGEQAGTVNLMRVYGDAVRNPHWMKQQAFHFVHSGCGKNASDLLLSIDAIELATLGGIDRFVIASSDGDFCHLARRLREKALIVLGVGKAQTSASFQAVCNRFHQLPMPVTTNASKQVGKEADKEGPSCSIDKLDRKIRDVICGNQSEEKPDLGVKIQVLGTCMKTAHGITTKQISNKSWHAYLKARPHLYDLDTKGGHSIVRFKPEGFAASR